MTMQNIKHGGGGVVFGKSPDGPLIFMSYLSFLQSTGRQQQSIYLLSYSISIMQFLSIFGTLHWLLAIIVIVPFYYLLLLCTTHASLVCFSISIFKSP